MVRPEKLYKVERNGESLKVFEKGVYVGSISLIELGVLVKDRKRKHPTGVNTQ